MIKTDKILLFLIRILASIPTLVLYFFSDFLLFPTLYYLISYRKKVVLKNLKNAFPEKSENEIKDLCKRYYHFLGDLMVETLKAFKITNQEFSRRIKYKNLDLLNSYFAQNKNIMLSLGHLGNYEWVGLFLPQMTEYKILVPYRKLTNPTSEKVFKENRSRLGTIVFPTLETAQNLKKKYEKPTALFMANDQSAHPYKSFWTRFLNQDTSFYPGTEKLAKIFDLPVFFLHITRPKRGYYEVDFELITSNPKSLKEGEILTKHAEILQADIEKNPEIWLWSHKRWKHKMPAELDYGFIEPHKRKIRH